MKCVCAKFVPRFRTDYELQQRHTIARDLFEICTRKPTALLHHEECGVIA